MRTNVKIMAMKILETCIAAVSLAAPIAGFLTPAAYTVFIPEAKMPFIFAQDAITIPAAILLLALALFGGRASMKLDMLRIGIVGYLLYAFGPLVMGTIYNSYYFLYMAIFSLSIFYLFAAFSGGVYRKRDFIMPKTLRILLGSACLLPALLFTPQWIIAISNNTRNNIRPETAGFALNYYVYILDLCFLLPVCVVAAVLIFRNNKLGFFLGGMLPIKGTALMLSVATGFFCKPLFHQEMVAAGGAVLFSALTIAFLALSIAYFALTKITESETIPSEPETVPKDLLNDAFAAKRT